ncbi:Tn3 family transposase [Candidatus Nephthysia bennettiae]|uniref:Tn3 family transposase n=1 Tax=Candidatus Nephthysia bennettiae TaxID=3127016 RepID=A0A934K5J9_9BACT|nr:Tn3 family transposase [Candidatus Dormibacteraeota bacterium]
MAEQLCIADPSCFARYGERLPTQHEHAREIRREYGYRDYSDAIEELRDFLTARAWTTNDSVRLLFDRATAWMFDRKVLLPGATRLAKLVASVRADTAERLWRNIAGGVPLDLRDRLWGLLEVESGTRFSTLERLRTAPARVSGPEMVRALERAAEVAAVGVGMIDVSSVPASRLEALARYGMAAKAPALRDLTEPRRTATLVAAVQSMDRVAVDDALDLFDVLMASRLLARAERESARERLRTLPRFTRASAKLAAAIRVLLDATDARDELSVAQVWVEIERVVPRAEVAAALVAVLELVPAAVEEEDDVWRAELVKRYATVRPFLPLLSEVLVFGAAEPGQRILDAVRRLPELVGRKRVRAEEASRELVTGVWRRLVFENPDLEAGLVDHRAYAFCVLEQLHRTLRRRDVFAMRSERWADPRAQLLSGEIWSQARSEILAGLGLTEQPDAHLAELATALDAEYRAVAGRLPENGALEVVAGGDRIQLERLGAEPEPVSLTGLRSLVTRMLPRVDLPELLLEAHDWTGYLHEFTHISGAGARIDDLPLSVAAVLVAEACNIGVRPVVKPGVAALTRDRLSHVDQSYVRSETIAAANTRLLGAQAGIGLASAWGGGLVASVDGLRFVVPVATINAGPNPRYFGVRRGVTWLNAVNDRYSGLGAVVVPGTVRDSLYLLDTLLSVDAEYRPEVVVTDTAGYSDMVFGLFRLLGYQFSPRLRDLSDTRFWRIDRGADYGPLNALARSHINLGRIRENWPDMLRVAGSLVTGAVRAYDLLRMLARDGRPSALGQAFAEYGRIAKTLHLLAYVDVDDAYRRQIGAQLNIQESRHQLARRIFHGHRGELRQRYREGQEDQLSALGLVLNAVVLWNTRYMDLALTELRARGVEILEADVARLSPLGFRHINFLGRYAFTPPEPGRLRPLRNPERADEECDDEAVA